MCPDDRPVRTRTPYANYLKRRLFELARRLHKAGDIMSTAYQQIVRRRQVALRFEKFFLAAVGIITTATLTVII